jgi:GTP pyrophosphokinase
MVSVVHSLQPASGEADALSRLCAGLPEEAAKRAAGAFVLAREAYGEKTLGTGESILQHALGMALIVASLDLDAEARIAALLFAASDHVKDCNERLKAGFGDTVAGLVAGLHRLGSLRPLTRAAAGGAAAGEGVAEVKAQTEILRKMLLAMVDDIRVVLLRLASRGADPALPQRPATDELRDEMARESLLIYAPLANRLGIWHVKWELEDLSFRYLEPETYKRIAKMLDEKRSSARASSPPPSSACSPRWPPSACAPRSMAGPSTSTASGTRCAARTSTSPRCTTCVPCASSSMRSRTATPRWASSITSGSRSTANSTTTSPIPRAISIARCIPRSKPRTAARWRCRSAPARCTSMPRWGWRRTGATRSPAPRQKAVGAYEDKISWLRQLLSWRDEIADSAEWVQQFKRAALDDTIYVLTPQDKVIDLPAGATALDFAYRLHTDVGHRCRGARVNGHMTPLNKALQSGQRVEIVTVKDGGPSRDWLNPAQGYLATSRARSKVKQWFAAQDEAELLGQGRSLVTRELQREGQTQANLDELAAKLGLKSAEAMFLAAARGELGMRAIDNALRGGAEPLPPEPEIHTRKSKAGDSRILVVGVDKLLTQVGTCCKPMPPDAITGFVTRGKGISIHRVECINFRNMAARNPERVISAEWGEQWSAQSGAVYPVDLLVDAGDRQGLLRDISDVLSREKINVTAVKTQSRAGMAHMSFTVELTGTAALQKALASLREVSGVISAKRR